MKVAATLVALSIQLFLSIHSFAQQSNGALIRKREEMERQAILKSDTVQLARLMYKKIIVQNPENNIVGFRQIMDRIKSGKINYASFERRIDTIVFRKGVAVVMGLETLIPRGATQNAGKTIQRRFTNIWIKEHGDWKLTARQATIVSAN
jgi:hypothetical protein